MSEQTQGKAFSAAVFTVFLTITALALMARPDRATAGQEGPYAGIASCAVCHEELVASYKASAHGQQGFEMRSPHACEECHGPGSAHVEAGGGKGSLVMPAALSKDQQSEMCLKCHDAGKNADWDGSRHQTRGLVCGDCHSIHHFVTAKAQLKVPGADLCFTCHKHQKAQSSRASHHPIREGLMDCGDCHDPHTLQEGKLVNEASVDETCYRCHAEKRGPFLWEHVSVREDCMTCHDAHGSNHVKMLRAKEPFLCQRCHSDTRHPGTLYDQTQLKLESNRLFGRSCTNCHSTIHGSNHPSGHTFLR